MFTTNQLLGHDPAACDVIEYPHQLEHTTGWVGGIRCIDTLVPVSGGFVNIARFKREFERATLVPPGAMIASPERATAREVAIADGRTDH